jgi:protein-S-isoprenylcysteine O-methyltransferase Ste14
MIHDWPAVLIGVILAAYWARVIRLVIKVRKQTGKAGNFVPPEPLGRVLRVLWYPTVALWIAHPFQVAFRPVFSRVLLFLYDLAVLRFAGVAIAAASLAFTLVCWKKMGKSWRMGIDPGEKTQLIVSGPYAYVRHPIYALSSAMMIGSVIAVPSPLMILLAVIHISFLQWEARREESYLLQVHGPVYGEYLAGVGRFLPQVRRRVVNPAASADDASVHR